MGFQKNRKRNNSSGSRFINFRRLQAKELEWRRKRAKIPDKKKYDERHGKEEKENREDREEREENKEAKKKEKTFARRIEWRNKTDEIWERGTSA